MRQLLTLASNLLKCLMFGHLDYSYPLLSTFYSLDFKPKDMQITNIAVCTRCWRSKRT